MPTYEIKYVETCEYAFNVNAESGEAANAVAERILIGDQSNPGMLRLVAPEGAVISTAVTERELSATPTDKTVPTIGEHDLAYTEARASHPDTDVLLANEEILRRLYEMHANEDDETADRAVAEDMLWLCENQRFTRALREAIWDGSHMSNVLSDIVDTTFTNLMQVRRQETNTTN